MAKYLNNDLIFHNRAEAGKELSEKIVALNLKNPLVIALPRGGVAVAEPIANALHTKVNIIVSKKIGAPGNPELAIGAVTSLGDYVISSSAEAFHETPLQDRKWDYLQEQIVYLINDCKEREKKYLGKTIINHSLYTGRNIVLVDDGTATGMTALAAIKSIKKQNPKSIILAIPVISEEAYDELLGQVNRIETLKIPEEFIAVGVHYKDFSPVSDEEIKSMLEVQ